MRNLLKRLEEQGRGMGPGGRCLGPGGKCKCPKCGHEEEHQTAEACMDKACPKCGAKMIREDLEEATSFGKMAKPGVDSWKKVVDAIDENNSKILYAAIANERILDGDWSGYSGESAPVSRMVKVGEKEMYNLKKALNKFIYEWDNVKAKMK